MSFFLHYLFAMKLKKPLHLSRLLLASAFLTPLSYAQDIDTLKDEVKQLEDLKEDTEGTKDRLLDEEYQEKQKRIARNIADATSHTQKNIAKAAKSEMHKRALELNKQQSNYLEGLKNGKTRAFPEIVENWEYYQSQVVDLAKNYKTYKATESTIEKAKLATPMLASLKLIGPWLENAEHSSLAKVEATDEMVAEINHLRKRYHGVKSLGPEGKMKLITPSYLYTLKHLPVPIQFSGPSETEVVLYSEVGGTFPNGLSYISIITDDNGLASTSWVSKGDGVATCSILYRSTELPERDKINISVKRLSLFPLEHISPLAEVADKTLNKSLTILINQPPIFTILLFNEN